MELPSIEKPGQMLFVDKCLDDDLTSLIEKMVNYHVDRNYDEVRNIILGYDSKNKEWKSRYGESLEKKLFGGGQTIAYTSSVYSLFLDTENFSKQTMVFYEDDIYNNVRFHMDGSVKRVLEILFTISDKVIDYRHIIDLIVTEWNLKNMKNDVTDDKMDTNHDIHGDICFHQIEVRENAWRELKNISKFKRLTIKDAFKQAVIGFLENRADMLRERYHDASV